MITDILMLQREDLNKRYKTIRNLYIFKYSQKYSKLSFQRSYTHEVTYSERYITYKLCYQFMIYYSLLSGFGYPLVDLHRFGFMGQFARRNGLHGVVFDIYGMVYGVVNVCF